MRWILTTEQMRDKAIATLQRTAITVPMCLEITEWKAKRNADQNKKLHAMIADISKQRQWAGAWLDVETWKRLLMAAFCRAQHQSATFYPALDGQGFDVVYRRTSKMSLKEMSEFIEYLLWYCADNEIQLVAA